MRYRDLSTVERPTPQVTWTAAIEKRSISLAAPEEGGKVLNYVNYGMIGWMIRHDPLAVLGLVFVGSSAVLSYHLRRKLQEAGEKNLNQLITIPDIAFFTLPRTYLRARSKYGWPAWPAHAVWFVLVSGIVLLVLGVARLGD